MESYKIIGAGLTGSVLARHLADKGHKVTIWEKRDHIGGNMYDYIDEHGFLVQKYGPHTFHTNKQNLYDYMCRYEDWQDYKLTCGAVWDNKYTPTPFNFTTIDTFYSPEKGKILKEKLKRAFDGRDTATVVEVLNNPDVDIREYAQYLFKNDYAPYTAKQWGISPDEIDVSVLKRVPLRFSYEQGYFADEFQAMPVNSFTSFFSRILDHDNITVELGVDGLKHIKIDIDQNRLLIDGKKQSDKVIYTGALDELFGCVYGKLPYRSLRFEWKHTDNDSYQNAPVVAYPQEKGYTRITEYKKLQPQDKCGSTYAIEFPLPYNECEDMEPYYPVLTDQSKILFEKYNTLAQKIPNLICCGRLGDFKYYNIDQALERALQICTALN